VIVTRRSIVRELVTPRPRGVHQANEHVERRHFVVVIIVVVIIVLLSLSLVSVCRRSPTLVVFFFR